MVRRSGFTLIECMGVVAMIGVLLSLCAGTLNRAYQVHRGTLQTFRELEQLNFWCDRFRADTLQAIEVKLGSDAQLVRETGETVRYAVTEGRLARIVERDTQVIAREAWHGPQLSQVDWSMQTNGRVPLIACELHFEGGAKTLGPIKWLSRLPELHANGATDDH